MSYWKSITDVDATPISPDSSTESVVGVMKTDCSIPMSGSSTAAGTDSYISEYDNSSACIVDEFIMDSNGNLVPFQLKVYP